MENTLYKSTTKKFAVENINWMNDNIKAVLLSPEYRVKVTKQYTSGMRYVPVIENSATYADIKDYVLEAETNPVTLTNKVTSHLGDPNILSAGPATFIAVKKGQTAGCIAFFKDIDKSNIDGEPTNALACPLIAITGTGYIDGVGTNGFDITLTWDSVNGIIDTGIFKNQEISEPDETDTGFNTISDILESINNIADLPPTFMSAISAHIEHAVYVDSKSKIEILEKQLHTLHSALRAIAPSDVIKELHSSSSTPSAINAAYILGQIGFADTLINSLSYKIAGDSFLNAMEDSDFKLYLDNLYKDHLTISELSSLLGQDKSTIIDKISNLIELNIVDFRKSNRDGSSLMQDEYFLTPAASSYYAANY